MVGGPEMSPSGPEKLGVPQVLEDLRQAQGIVERNPLMTMSFPFKEGYRPSTSIAVTDFLNGRGTFGACLNLSDPHKESLIQALFHGQDLSLLDLTRGDIEAALMKRDSVRVTELKQGAFGPVRTVSWASEDAGVGPRRNTAEFHPDGDFSLLLHTNIPGIVYKGEAIRGMQLSANRSPSVYRDSLMIISFAAGEGANGQIPS